MLRLRTLSLPFIFIVIALSGCSSAQLRNTSPENRSLVFAYIDFSEIEMVTKWADIKQMSPVIDEPYRGLGRIPDPGGRGKYTVLFWHEDLPNGSYQISSIGGTQTLILRHANLTLELGEVGQNDTSVRINTPGIYFLGAYKYHPTVSTWATQFGAPGKFELIPLEEPKPEELLGELLKISDGTAWKAQIQRAISRTTTSK